MVLNTTPINNLLALVLAQAKQKATKFINIKYYHVLQENYRLVDGFTNATSSQKEGVININEIVTNQPIT
jgi:hypothetical protein